MKHRYYALILFLASPTGAFADTTKKETTTTIYDTAKSAGYSAFAVSEAGLSLFLLKELVKAWPKYDPKMGKFSGYALIMFAWQAKHDAEKAYAYFQKKAPAKDTIESSSTEDRKTTGPSSEKLAVAKFIGYSLIGGVNMTVGLLVGLRCAREFHSIAIGRRPLDPAKMNVYAAMWAMLPQTLFRLGISNLSNAKDQFKKAFTSVKIKENRANVSA